MKEEKYEVVKFIDEQIEIDVNVSPNENTVWLTQKQMSFLFGASVDNISLHVKNIFKDKELDNSVAEEYSVTAADGKRYKTNIHDRFVIIDNKELYHLGASIKDAGKKYLQLTKWIMNLFIHYYKN